MGLKLSYTKMIALAIFCLSEASAKAIVIRHDTNDQEYLELGEKYSSSVAYLGGCAATLIDDSWLLTAAHCVKGDEDTIYSVQHLGNPYRVENIVSHPEFGAENNHDFDIALIQLKEPIKDGRPVNLYHLQNEVGKLVIFVGRGTYGNGQDGLIQDDGKQRGATNTVISASEQFIDFTFDAPPNATITEGISGRGDSGGPAFIFSDSELYVAGVSSHQNGNGNDEGTYGVAEYYTRVSTHISWLQTVIDNAQPPVSLPKHAIIEAIKFENAHQLRESINEDILEDDEVMNEAFYQSIILNRIEMAEYLISQGADISSIMINVDSIFEHALRHGNISYFDMLLKKTSKNKLIHKKQSTVLPQLVDQFGNDPDIIERVGILLDQGANIDAQIRGGESAIILAGWHTNNLKLIGYLIERGADVDMQNINGDNPLIDAAYLGKNEILEYLLDNGADVHVKNNDGYSALDMAIKKENEAAIQMLISHGKNR